MKTLTVVLDGSVPVLISLVHDTVDVGFTGPQFGHDVGDLLPGELSITIPVVDPEGLSEFLFLVTESSPCGHVVNEGLQADSSA